jgi:hypothetical protein
MKPVNATPKIHPASRELLPDDPMEMTGFQVPGDSDLMLRILVEEYARAGWGTDSLMELARDPNYRAFHGFLRTMGENALLARIREIMARCGTMRVSVREKVPWKCPYIQVELPQQ